MARPREPRWTSGYLRVASVRGAPVLFHWTIPVALFALGRFQLRPGLWVAGTLLILAHELGHAALVWRYGGRVLALKVMPIGGLCEYRGAMTETQVSKIAWGGVLVQAAVWVVAAVAVALAGHPSRPWSSDVVWTLTEANLWVIALNLFPLAPLDGAEAWKLPTRWMQSVMQRAENEKVRRQLAAQRAKQRAEAERVRVALTVDPTEALDDDALERVNAEAAEIAARMWDEARRKGE